MVEGIPKTLAGIMAHGTDREDTMAIWVSSDWHCNPDELKQAVVDWIVQGKEGNHHLVGDGDLFDILPWGRERWTQPTSVEELNEVLNDYPFDYVAGNHDPYNVMKNMMASYPNITVHKRLELEECGRKYFITHGHRWAVDWGFLGLRYIAPWIVELMVDIAPGLWYRFCRSRGWLASRLDTAAPSGREKDKITRLTRIVWAGASDHALKRDCCVVLGHTHTISRRERGISKEQGFQAYMVDDGNLPDGTYVEITDDARLRFLP
jgi:predicted phosphodiesterase